MRYLTTTKGGPQALTDAGISARARPTSKRSTPPTGTYEPTTCSPTPAPSSNTSTEAAAAPASRSTPSTRPPSTSHAAATT
jgi:hypothetical protein